MSQLGSFVAVVIIGIFFLVRRAKEKKLGRLIWPAPEVAEAPAEAAEQPEPEQGEGEVMVEQVEAVFFTRKPPRTQRSRRKPRPSQRRRPKRVLTGPTKGKPRKKSRRKRNNTEQLHRYCAAEEKLCATLP